MTTMSRPAPPRTRDAVLRSRPVRGDRGSVLILGLGVVVISLLALVVGVDASAAFLQRRALVALADASALAGAQGIDMDSYYRHGASQATSLDARGVAARVTAFVEQADTIEGLRLERVVTDGRSVTVRMSAPLRLPFLSVLDFGDQISDPVMVEARALLSYRAMGQPG